MSCWRVKDYCEGEIFELGWEEAQTSQLMLVEWAEKLKHYVPEDALTIKFELSGEERRISFFGNESWAERIKDL